MVADDIDNCIGIFNDEQVDGDSDGVGDACDPNPGADDRVERFEVFFDRIALTPSDGAFELESDGVVPTNPTEEIAGTLELVIPDSDRTGVSLEVGFRPLDFGVMGNENRFGIQIAATDSSTVACSVNEDDATNMVSSGTLDHTGGIEPLDPEPNVLPDALQRLVLDVHIGDGARCTFRGVSAARPQASGTGSAGGDLTITIEMFKLRARLEYLVVYDTTRP